MEKDSRPPIPSAFQLVWGTALTLMGLALFFKVPELMVRVAEVPTLAGASSFVRFSLYFVAVVLMAGGVGKISIQYRALQLRNRETESEGEGED